jgi:tellurite resistance protein TerC
LTPWWLWLALGGGLVVLLLLDLFFFHRRPEEVGVRQAVGWSVVWLALGLGFAFAVWAVDGATAAREYLAGYLIERTLSLDNLFVLAVILGYFAVPNAYRHRALLWGVVGALVFRALFIAVGGVALDRLSWLPYVLGVFLIATGIRLARREIEVKPEKNRIVALVRRVLPMTRGFHGQRLFVRIERKLLATPMVAVLAAVATTDAAFAADSIPAIYAVTDDPFLVFAANAFSVLGLLAMYFLLAEIMVRFRYLRPALAVILVFVGAKMALANVYHAPISLSLAVIVGVITTAVVVSLLRPEPLPRVRGRITTDATRAPVRSGCWGVESPPSDGRPFRARVAIVAAASCERARPRGRLSVRAGAPLCRADGARTARSGTRRPRKRPRSRARRSRSALRRALARLR